MVCFFVFRLASSFDARDTPRTYKIHTTLQCARACVRDLDTIVFGRCPYHNIITATRGNYFCFFRFCFSSCTDGRRIRFLLIAKLSVAHAPHTYSERNNNNNNWLCYTSGIGIMTCTRIYICARSAPRVAFAMLIGTAETSGL